VEARSRVAAAETRADALPAAQAAAEQVAPDVGRVAAPPAAVLAPQAAVGPAAQTVAVRATQGGVDLAARTNVVRAARPAVGRARLVPAAKVVVARVPGAPAAVPTDVELVRAVEAVAADGPGRTTARLAVLTTADEAAPVDAAVPTRRVVAVRVSVVPAAVGAGTRRLVVDRVRVVTGAAGVRRAGIGMRLRVRCGTIRLFRTGSPVRSLTGR
jgi:hypothetical protein